VSDLFEQIAVVGMSARWPGARNLQEFWHNLRDGRDCISMLTDAELMAAGVPAAQLTDPAYVKAAGLLPDLDRFDAEYFEMNPREAEICDPQLRLILEVSHEAVENAGYSSESIGYDVAVFATCGPSWYAAVNVLRNLTETDNYDLSLSVLNNIDYLSTLVSYKLNFRGPSMAVLTACSSSLSAIHQACQSLRLGECDAALVAASNVHIPYGAGYRWLPGGVRSMDGHCRPFDAAASGTIFTNGAGAVLLKRLDDAINDGDDVRGVICGVGMNNDGSDKVSFSAPSVPSQARAVVDAMNLAAVDPQAISFVEMHATGTALGDPIELSALATAYRHLAGDSLKPGSIAVGSVKSNVGHTGNAAGMVALLKVLLALEHDELPPTANLNSLNPRLEIDTTPFTVPTKPQAWPRVAGQPRLAGVTSLGIGGTNVHLVLAEGPAKSPTPHRERPRVVIWSGRDEQAERAYRTQLAGYFDEAGDRPFADAVTTLQQGRREHPVRGALVCRGPAEAAARLIDGSLVVSGAARGPAPRVVFEFPGEEHAYPRLAAGLYGTQRVFSETLDLCLHMFAGHGLDLYSQWQDHAAESMSAPLLFAVEYALADMLMDTGVQPEEAAGEGVGATVAAVVAGTLTLDEAIRLVARGESANSPVRRVPAEGAELCVRVGPDRTGTPPGTVPMLPAADGRHGPGDPDELSVMTALATLWTRGVPVRWKQLYLDEPLQRVGVPGYPFQRRRHWIDIVPAAAGDASTAQPARSEPDTPFVQPRWVEEDDQPVAEQPQATTCLALLPADPTNAARAVAALERVASRVVRVAVGPAFAMLDGRFTVRGDHLPEDLDRVLAHQRARGGSPDLVVHALGTGQGWSIDRADDDLEETFFALLALIQRAARHPVDGRLPAVLVLSDNAVDVSGEEPLHPARAAMLAQLSSFAIESPGQRCRMVDIGAGVTEEAITSELRRETAAPIVALRGSRRWRRTDRPFRTRDGERSALREDGVYVLTGGTGGLGGAVATALAATGLRPRLALLSRGSAGLAENVERLRATLTAAGARLEVIACDVADEQALDRALDRVVDIFGPVDGVFHLAGVAGRPMLQAMDRTSAAEVLRPKVAGTIALRRCLAHRPPTDFVVCFSSQAAHSGMIGGADYAAANAFLDAVAAVTPGWLSINWPAWAEAGMAAGGVLDTVADRLRAGGAIQETPTPADELYEEAFLSPESTWAMDEHRIGGEPVLPGTAVLDMVITAYLRVVPGAHAPVALRELVFQRPVAGDDPRRIRIAFRPDDIGWRVRVLSKVDGEGAAWLQHASCSIGPSDAAARSIPLETVMADGRLVPPLSLRHGDGFDFGPRWDVARRRWESADSTLVELELHAAYTAEAEAYSTHPGLLDIATGILNATGGDVFYAPFLYQSMTWRRPLPARCFSLISVRHRSTESLILDVDLVTPDGEVVAEVEGLRMHRIRATDFVGGAPDPAVRPVSGLSLDAGVKLLFSLLDSRTPAQVAVLPHAAGGAVRPDVPPAAAARPAAKDPSPDRPTRPVAEMLRLLWSELLGQDVDGASDFFDLGGDSLAAVALTGKIRDELGVEIGLGTVFDFPTLDELAEAITTNPEAVR